MSRPGAARTAREAERVTLRRYYGEKRDSSGSALAAGWRGLPVGAPRGEREVQADRQRRADPAPAPRIAEGRGSLRKAGPSGLGPACSPLSAAARVRSSLSRARSLHRPPRTSHRNPAPPLRRAGLCPSSGACLAKGRTATKAGFLKKKKEKSHSPEAFSGVLGTTGHSRAAESPQGSKSSAEACGGVTPRQHKPSLTLPEGRGVEGGVDSAPGPGDGGALLPGPAAEGRRDKATGVSSGSRSKTASAI